MIYDMIYKSLSCYQTTA